MGNIYVPGSVGFTPTRTGPLTGLTFAVKDNFNLQGRTAGNGSPTWAATHAPATQSAPLVIDLLEAGAELSGVTICDELCFSINGENAHYGTPPNPRAPGRIAGGSSSGSVAAVATGDVDFALGTDTSGSVRIPASYCGIFGIRTSHGAPPLQGVVPLAPSFDTIGMFARSAEVLHRIGKAVNLAEERSGDAAPTALFIPDDILELVDEKVATSFGQVVVSIQKAVGCKIVRGPLAEGHNDLAQWREHLRSIQARDIWTGLGDWVEANAASFGPGMEHRLRWGQRVSDAQLLAANTARPEIISRIDSCVPPGVIMLMPTAPGIAPLRRTPAEDQIEFRDRAVALGCIACLGRRPEVTMPLLEKEGMPVGVSLMGGRGDDLWLLKLAATISETLCLPN